MPNIQRLIQADNSNKLQPHRPETNPTVTCNCRKKEDCPLQNQCLTKELVYQAEVKTDESIQSYVGLAATDFKARYRNHTSSFRDQKKRFSTELSKYIWSLKDINKQYTIHWKILCRARAYSNITKKCNLCTSEKYFIICRPELATLNKRSELLNKCRHRHKFTLNST